MANVVPAETEAEGIDQVRSVLAGTANHVFRFTLDGKGLPDELIPKVKELKQRYDSSHHASPETAAHNAALVDELGLTSWLAKQSTIAGPIEHCIERLHEVAEAGVKRDHRRPVRAGPAGLHAHLRRQGAARLQLTE